MKKSYDVSIIIPAYNEEGRIKKTLKIYNDYLKKHLKKKYEILVICNGCTDNTHKIVEDFSRKYRNIKLFVFEQKLGKGGAIKEGVKVSKGNIIGFLDADSSTYPESVLSLLRKIEDYDGVIGSRWMKNSKIIRRQPFIRIILSRGFNILVRFLFDLDYTDTQCGAKFFKRQVIKEVYDEMKLTDWSFDVELLFRMKLKGYRVIEHEIKWSDSSGSKLNNFKTPIKMFFSVVSLRMKFGKSMSKVVNSRIGDFIYRLVKKL